MRLVLATRNPHKLREFAAVLAGHQLLPLPDDVVLPAESGETFAENALIKAKAGLAATGIAAIADDSGIAAFALGGRPGVHSARYAGEHATDNENLDKLILELAAYDDRRVEYVCALAVVGVTADDMVFEGRCQGQLIDSGRGDNGFGYDPAFVPVETGAGDARTMAELSPAEKDQISHRGKAARAFLQWLAAIVPAK